MPLRIVLQSGLFAEATDQDVTVRDHLPVRALIHEICREFGLPGGSYDLVDDADQVLNAPTLEAAGVRQGATLRFREGVGQRTAVLRAPNGAAFTLRRRVALVGRPNEKAGLTADMLDADLSTLDTKRQVSRPHAKITQEKDGFWVECVSNVNHLRVNERDVGPHARVPLQPRDRLLLGGVQLVFDVVEV